MSQITRTLCVVLCFIAAMANSAAAENIASQVNAFRRAHGLSGVQLDRRLTALARQQAEAMASHEIVGHNVVASFQSRMAGVPVSLAAENVAAGFNTFPETLQQWEDSPGHRANLLMAGARRIGVASVSKPSSPYRRFWAMLITD